jgi:hypothetical protein
MPERYPQACRTHELRQRRRRKFLRSAMVGAAVRGLGGARGAMERAVTLSVPSPTPRGYFVERWWFWRWRSPRRVHLQ